MPFCPRCRFEYRPGIRRCPECGAAMADRLPSEPSVPVVPDANLSVASDFETIAPMEAVALLVTVTGVPHAWLLQDALRAHGIDSRLEMGPAPPLTLWIPATIRAARHPLVDVYVRPEDLDLARQIHTDFEASARPDSRPSSPAKPRPRRPRRRRW
jgi:hypothetical protein